MKRPRHYTAALHPHLRDVVLGRSLQVHEIACIRVDHGYAAAGGTDPGGKIIKSRLVIIEGDHMCAMLRKVYGAERALWTSYFHW